MWGTLLYWINIELDEGSDLWKGAASRRVLYLYSTYCRRNHSTAEVFYSTPFSPPSVYTQRRKEFPTRAPCEHYAHWRSHFKVKTVVSWVWGIFKDFVIFKYCTTGQTHIELLICCTCCGVSANAKQVSRNRWLLSDAGRKQEIIALKQ